MIRESKDVITLDIVVFSSEERATLLVTIVIWNILGMLIVHTNILNILTLTSSDAIFCSTVSFRSAPYRQFAIASIEFTLLITVEPMKIKR